mmetsp:Transcript_46750/g.56175  ORF Transcript_46750/g.56175 Transcript_46750/m.56175 type:complete len:558 (+) Transcript_46750:45-1718(+)
MTKTTNVHNSKVKASCLLLLALNNLAIILVFSVYHVQGKPFKLKSLISRNITAANDTNSDGCVQTDLDDYPIAAVDAFFAFASSTKYHHHHKSIEDGHYDEEEAIAESQLQIEIQTLSSQLSIYLTSTQRKLSRLIRRGKAGENSSNDLIPQTWTIVRKKLEELGISYTTNWAKTNVVHTTVGNENGNLQRSGGSGFGIVAEIGSGSSPCVLLFFDMCADGTHTAMGLGAAAVLKQMESSLQGTVRLLFQPSAEASVAGDNFETKKMVNEGALHMEPKVEAAYGVSVSHALHSGSIGSRPGIILGSAKHFTVTISSVVVSWNDTAAVSQSAADPILASSSMVMSLQTIMEPTSKFETFTKTGFVSVTRVVAGDNLEGSKPKTVTLVGILHALDTETLILLQKQVKNIVVSLSKVHGCHSTIEFTKEKYPPTMNDPALYSFSETIAATVSRNGRVVNVQPTVGAECFSFVAEKIPSTLFLLGQGSDEQDQSVIDGSSGNDNFMSIESKLFQLNDNILVRGVELHTTLALFTLKMLLSKAAAAIEDARIKEPRVYGGEC